MAAKKKVIKKRVNLEEKHSAFDSLYINMTDVGTKRKNLLYALKNSLVMQEEYERIVECRKEKVLVLAEIKKSMESLNSNYQKIKKVLPNVKNVISFTEKELKDLEMQVESIKGNIRSRKKEVTVEENIIDNMKKSMDLKQAKAVANYVKDVEEKVPEKKPVIKKKPAPVKNLTKLDRIKNNLKIIESKLSDI